MLLNNLIILPSTLSLFMLSLVLLNWRCLILQKICHAIGLVILWSLSLIILQQVAQHDCLTLQLGSWQAPFGITFIADRFSAIVFVAMATVLLCGGLYALADIENEQFNSGFLMAFWVLTLGICGVLFTGDLFNLYVWFEVILIGSFILLGLGKPTFWLYNKFKYVILNLIGTFLMLTAIGLMYGYTGSLNMASFAQTLLNQSNAQNGLLLSILLIFVTALMIKSAVFPVFNWLPAAYHSTSHTTSSLMGSLITKVGLYVIIRFYFTIYPLHSEFLNSLILFLALATMIIGVLGAVAQNDYRRILAFDIVSQVGYVLLTVGLATRQAIAAGIFFLIQNIITKMTLFMSSGIAHAITGEQDIRRMGGIYQQYPKVAMLFLISGLSLAGLPPLAGFWGKFLIIQSAATNGQLALTVIALIVSLITLYVMTRLWHLAYWQPPQTYLNLPHKPKQCSLGGIVAPTAIGLVGILILSFNPWPFYHFIEGASFQLTHPTNYIHAVLGGSS